MWWPPPLPSQGRRQGADPPSISSINEAAIFSSAVGPSKVLREWDLDAGTAGKARDARVVPREGKGGDGACRRAACVALARGATMRKPARPIPRGSVPQ